MAEPPAPIALADLPAPPAEIRELLKAGQVAFESGRREADPDPRNGPRITAETHFRIAYNYNARSRWRVDSQRRRIMITVRFSDLKWQPIHRIWFEDRPPAEDFWTNRLVLHEFDHVRISTDPRVAKRFEQMLRNRGSIAQSLSAGDVVNRDFVNRLVDEHVAATVAEVSDLISIRYRELDRLTNHGLDPLPADSSLSGLLRPQRSDTLWPGPATPPHDD